MKTDPKKNLFPLSPKTEKSLEALLAMMAKLRGPSGCPWDREQTEQTLKKHLLEESYEVLEAIETGAPEELKEELGDLLLQILFLSRIAEEKGQFNFDEVAQGLSRKLIRRHPHIFPPLGREADRVRVQSAAEVVEVWHAVKEKEGKNARKTSVLDGIPLALPALERARKISRRVSRVGFDWPDIRGVWEKIQEELAELQKAARDRSPQAVEEELGDLLFSVVNWARFQGLSAEEALRKANRRFTRRFRQIERSLRERGRSPRESNLAEMDQLWKKIKEEEKKRQNPESRIQKPKKNPGARSQESE